jgi:hypothetical protein
VSGDEQKVNGIIYTNRILAYVDILGWRDLIRRSMDDVSVMEVVARGVASLRRESILLAAKGSGEPDNRGILLPEVTVFSDTVVASCVPHPTAIKVLVSQVQFFCVGLMVAGLYTRGAIVSGKLHHHDGVILGPALVDAYELETKVAKYPRIVVADALLYADGPFRARIQPGATIKDHDGLHVLNLFMGGMFLIDPSFIPSSRERIASELKETRDMGIRAKLGWLLDYLDRVEKIVKRG